MEFNTVLHLINRLKLTLAIAACTLVISGCSNGGSNGSNNSYNSSSSSSSSSSSGAAKPSFETADGINGGRLYSKFWANETGFSLGNSNLGVSDMNSALVFANFPEFFRCKNCHGWDLLGQEGAYSNRGPNETRPAVADVNLAQLSEMLSPQELFDAIQTGSMPRREVTHDLSNYDPDTNSIEGDRMPNYGQIFTEAQIWDLVKFLKEEANNTTLLYELQLGAGTYPNQDRSFSDIGRDGDAANGDQIYANHCASCHGADGMTLLIDDEYSIGYYGRHKPYEVQHKVKFGNLGSTMGAVMKDSPIEDIRDLLKALTNESQYPDAVNGAQLFVDNCGACHSANGMGAGSDRTNRTAIQIQNAIANVNAMSGLSWLNDKEIDAIAEAIKAPLNGAQLFVDNCGGCHSANGLGTGSDRSGRTATQIQNAINNVNAMSGLSSISAEEINAIAEAIQTPPLNGEQLFLNNCGGCHSANGLGSGSDRTGRTAAQIRSAISAVGAMNRLSNLSDDEINAIAEAIDPS